MFMQRRRCVPVDEEVRGLEVEVQEGGRELVQPRHAQRTVLNELEPLLYRRRIRRVDEVVHAGGGKRQSGNRYRW